MDDLIHSPEVRASAQKLFGIAPSDPVLNGAIIVAASNVIAIAAVTAPEGQVRILKSMLDGFGASTRKCFRHLQKQKTDFEAKNARQPAFARSNHE